MARRCTRSNLEGEGAQAALWLLLAGATSLAVYLAWWATPLSMTEVNPRQGWLDPQDLFDDRSGGLSSYVKATAVPFGLYLLALLAARRAPDSRWTAGVALAGSAALPLALLLTYPALSADVFDYLVHGRLWLVYGENPMTTVPQSFPFDPWFRSAAWPHTPFHYGPLFLWLLMLPLKIAGDD